MDDDYNWPGTLTVEERVGIRTTQPSEALEVIGNISATGDISAETNLDVKKNIQLGGNLQFTTGLAISEFSDDGNLTDSSSSALPTEQAVKTYVDNQINTRAALNGAANQDFAANNLKVSGVVSSGYSSGALQVNNDLTVNGVIAASSLSVTANANIGGNLKVDGNREVMGDVTARDVEHVSGNVSFGDADDDEVKITGILRSGHSSGALRVDDALHTTGSLTIDGNVGIGTTTPTAKLEVTGDLKVNGTLTATGSLDLGGDLRLRGTDILTGGNVGIGTTVPQGKLDVRGDIRAGNSDLYFTKTDHNHTGIGNTKGYAAIENASNYGALMILGRAGTSKGRYVRLWDYLQVNGGMDITGNVGIGTTSPEAKLHVKGNTAIEGNLTVLGGITNAEVLQVTAVNRTAHVNTDGAIYRKGGQVYLTVDDNFYIRDSNSASNAAHFNTNPNGGLTVNGNLQIVRNEWAYLDIRCSKAGKDAVIRLYDSEHYWSIHNDDSAGNK
ncbi:MAG: hypothetical protein AB4372_38280, partial [Xenococcus sp. (in: cyanobacteria)]